jgi:hypothetical protein
MALDTRPMAKVFTEWTVLDNGPLEKHADNLWSVSGKMRRGNQRRMTLARRADGGLVVHNPIALNEDQMREIEAFGQPAFIVVPNAFHRQDSFIFKQRYPKAAVLCPKNARKRVSEVVEVSGHLDEMPKDAHVEMFHLRGMKSREGAIVARSGGKAALVFNDALLNLAPGKGLAGFFMAPTGTLSVPRFTRWMLTQSGAELKEHLLELSRLPELTHLVPGHGEVLSGGVAASLTRAAERL